MKIKLQKPESLILCLIVLMNFFLLYPVRFQTVHATEAWGWPVPGVTYMSRGFTSASDHSGVDIAHTGTNIEVVATRSGIVVEAAPTVCNHWNHVNCNHSSGTASYGNYIKIKHTDDNGTVWYSLYGHLVYDSLRYKVGDSVPQGAVIAYMGSTGYSTGQHLHFEIRKSPGNLSNCQNPLDYVTPGKVINVEKMKEPVVTTNKDTYAIGEIVNISWVASPSNSSLSHYWLQIFAPDGSTALNQTMNLQTYYSYKVSQAGTYRIVAWATPKGSVEGEGSLTSEKTITVRNPQYTVSFNANGGSGSMANQTMTIDVAVNLSTNSFTRTGYTFLGWNTDKNAATAKYTDKQSVKNLAGSGGSITLYAIWTANPYTVIFNSNGGSGTMSNQTIKRDVATALIANSFTKTGYTFAGWSTDKSTVKYTDKTSVTNIAAAGGSITLYAVWKAKSVTVTFYRNQNSSDTSSVQESFTYDVSNQKFGYKTDGTGRYSQMNDASVGFGQWTKTGYSMLGWNENRAATTSAYSTYSGVNNDWINSKSPSTSLYAIWKANAYKVTFDANYTNAPAVSGMSVTYDQTYGTMSAPERKGYAFNGWYTAKTGGTRISSDTKVQITAAQTLYAQWSQTSFLITFNAGGGTAEAADKLVTFDKAYGILPTAERTGYLFEGWYLDKDCTTPITEKSVVALTANQEVYAKWTLQKYLLTFDAVGGTAEADTKQVVYGKTYGALPTAEKANAVFGGWYTADGAKITSADTVALQQDTTLYAKWLPSGDVNKDGQFSIADAVMLHKWLICQGTLTDWKAGDFDENGRISASDLSLMKLAFLESEGEKL